MTLAIFDLDNTLLSGDSDFGWGNFLVQKEWVDKSFYESENRRFFLQYQQGKLDIYEYSAFSFKPLTEHTTKELDALHKEFMKEVIEPMMGTKAKQLIDKHKKNGHTLLVMTSTNSFVTGPIVKAFQIDNLIATDPLIVNGRYTTKIDGTPCFKEGKVKRLQQWMASNNTSLAGSFFYSDSHNDLPLLEQVDNPVAVNPDERLLEIAQERRWKIISLVD